MYIDKHVQKDQKKPHSLRTVVYTPKSTTAVLNAALTSQILVFRQTQNSLAQKNRSMSHYDSITHLKQLPSTYQWYIQ